MRSVRAMTMGLLVGAVLSPSARAGDDIPGYNLCYEPTVSPPPSDAASADTSPDGAGELPQLCDEDGILRTLPDMGFPARRWTEARLALTGMLSWPAPVEGRGAGGLRGMWAPYLPFGAPAFQWDVLVGGYVGSWGDTRHGGLTFETGLGARLRLLGLDFWGVGPMMNTTFLYSSSEGRVGFRGDIGLAGDLGRIVGAEISFTALVSDFEVEGEKRYFAPGLSGSLSFDFCSLSLEGCAHAPVAPQLDDRTCRIYGLAKRLCDAQGAAPNGDLCKAVQAGLDTYANPALGDDPVTAMLERAYDIAPEPARQTLAQLLTAHRQWRHWLENGAVARRQAAEVSETLAVKRRYSPYPVELAHALGCDGATRCERLCESDGAGP
jgi:hypothetical protein